MPAYVAYKACGCAAALSRMFSGDEAEAEADKREWEAYGYRVEKVMVYAIPSRINACRCPRPPMKMEGAYDE